MTGTPVRTGTDARILVVDDEEPIRRVLVRLLGKEGYECDVAADAAEARHKLQSQTFELMLCDVTMPGETGFSLLAYAAKAHPDTAVIMVTAIDSPDEASPAALHGAYGYIIKPFEPNSILINVATALTRRVERVVDKTRNAVLMDEISSRTEELKEALERLAAGDHALSISQEETVLRLALAAEWRDRDTGLHLKQMSTLSARLATLAGLPIDRVEQLRVASQMHDIGKIGLPDVVLLKAGPLDDDERIIVQTHSEIGFQMLQNSESPLIQLASIVARTHHERFDGTGYPCGLAGNAIPLEGRIVAIADVFDALRSERPYKHAFSLEKSLGIMRDGRGSHFDPDLLDLFVIDVEEQVNLLTSHRDEATLP